MKIIFPDQQSLTVSEDNINIIENPPYRVVRVYGVGLLSRANRLRLILAEEDKSKLSVSFTDLNSYENWMLEHCSEDQMVTTLRFIPVKTEDQAYKATLSLLLQELEDTRKEIIESSSCHRMDELDELIAECVTWIKDEIDNLS